MDMVTAIPQHETVEFIEVINHASRLPKIS